MKDKRKAIYLDKDVERADSFEDLAIGWLYPDGEIVKRSKWSALENIGGKLTYRGAVRTKITGKSKHYASFDGVYNALDSKTFKILSL